MTDRVEIAFEPHPERRDWFIVDVETAQALADVPGLSRDEKRDLWLAHRTHLVLLDGPSVQDTQRTDANQGFDDAQIVGVSPASSDPQALSASRSASDDQKYNASQRAQDDRRTPASRATGALRNASASQDTGDIRIPGASPTVDDAQRIEASRGPHDTQYTHAIFVDGTRLRDYQIDGVHYLKERRGALLADGLRVGKTAQAVAAHDPSTGPMVVVGPLAVRGVWLDWFRRRWPDKRAVVLRGKTYKPSVFQDAELIFTHYDILPSWASIGLIKQIGTLVFDEMHGLANHRSKRSQAAAIISPAAYRTIGLTGTPLWNKPAGLWSLLRICNPGAWGTFKTYTKAYASGLPGAYGWTTGGPSRVAELRDRLSEVMLRREWHDIQAELPPMVRTLESVPLDANEVLKLDKIAAAIREELVDLDLVSKNATVAGELERQRRLLAKRKSAVAADLGVRTLMSGEPVVIWVWHRDVAAKIASRIQKNRFDAYVVTGETPQLQRDPILEMWRAHSHAALVISMGVAPAGIDLSHSAHAIFAELDWTPATMGQAAMRTFSPSRPNFETYVLGEHPIEYRLMEVLSAKVATAGIMGVPATDTVGDSVMSMFDKPEASDVDLAILANEISARIQKELST